MNTLLEQMAEAMSEHDALRLRELAQTFLREPDHDAVWAEPQRCDARNFILAAGLAELLADRLDKPQPGWASRAGRFPQPFYALKAASRLNSVRELCEREAPEALRRHGILAPANFLILV